MDRGRREPRRSLPLWPFIVAAVLAIVAVVIVHVVLVRRQDGVDFFDHYVAETELPDGSILTLRAVTFGDHHELPLNQPKTGLMGFGRGGRGVPEFLERETPPSSVVLWFSRRDGQSGKTMDFRWWKRCSVVDAHGWNIKDRDATQECYSLDANGGFSGSTQWGGDRRLMDTFRTGEYDIGIVSTRLPSFRPSGKTFALKVHNVDGKVVAEFDVPWPGAATLPVWEPETLPATKSVGNLKVTLKALTVEEDRSQTSDRYGLHARADFEFSGMTAGAEWHLDDVRLEDALGNASDDYDCILSPLDSAWKVVALISRNEDAPLLASETWHVGKIQLPADGTKSDLKLSDSIGGVPIFVKSIGGPGEVTYVESVSGTGDEIGGFAFAGPSEIENFSVRMKYNGSTCRRTVKSKVPHLFLDNLHLKPFQSLRIQAVDDAGKMVDGRVCVCNDEAFWVFSPPPGSKSIDLKVIVTQQREVEFIAAPQLVTEEE
ncbi:hypothetical protein Mal52_17510 [Symmachiella dynata]|uniref:Uncharacterized protein n=1 Tax=Symmachiella dynata TaxID=2527995 RepID=A0A517ZLB4_9PLAN|nr:hypothetical protein [Symmachiella dynata]QDU43279.1 hypothetical protein Mal52_17510 [Symmachiella dynata]